MKRFIVFISFVLVGVLSYAKEYYYEGLSFDTKIKNIHEYTDEAGIHVNVRDGEYDFVEINISKVKSRVNEESRLEKIADNWQEAAFNNRKRIKIKSRTDIKEFEADNLYFKYVEFQYKKPEKVKKRAYVAQINGYCILLIMQFEKSAKKLEKLIKTLSFIPETNIY